MFKFPITIPANNAITIAIASGYKVNVLTYNNDGNARAHDNYVGVTEQMENSYTFVYDSAYQYSLCLRKSDGTDFDESTDNVLTSVTLSYLSSDSSEVTSVDVIRRNAPIETVERLQQLNRPTRTAYESLGTPPLVLLHFPNQYLPEISKHQFPEYPSPCSVFRQKQNYT